MSKRRGTNSRHGVVGRELQARDFTQQPCQAWFTPEDQEDDPGGLRGIFFFYVLPVGEWEKNVVTVQL